MKVKFVKVGRGNKTWSTETDKVDVNWLEREVSSKGGLISRGIDFTNESDIDSDEICDGYFGSVVVGGFRHVGKYYVGSAIPKGTGNAKEKD